MEPVSEKKEPITIEQRLVSLEEEKAQSTKIAYATPIAIVIAGLFISGSMFMQERNNPVPLVNVKVGVVDAIAEVTKKDHIRGEVDAPVKIVEFSDIECPFCKRHHATMKNIVATYGTEVAWVYRHFPLDSLHSKARIEARATECANELGGNDAFWEYLDLIFEETPSNNLLDLALLPVFAERIGLDRESFEACLDDDRHDKLIEGQYQDAIASGGSGTPYTVIIAPNGKKFALSGAQPEASIGSLIDLALKETK